MIAIGVPAAAAADQALLALLPNAQQSALEKALTAIALPSQSSQE